MYHRPGKQIKTLASVVLWVCIALGILVGLLLATSLDAAGQALTEYNIEAPASTASHVVIVLICGLIGTLVGWVNSILLYAYGSIADDLAYLREDVEAVKNYTASQAIRGGAQAAGKPTWMN